MDSFYWLIRGVLAGCGLPGRVGRMHGPADAVERDLAWLRAQGIAALLSLTEQPLAAVLLQECGMAFLHLPVLDMTPPSPEQLLQAIAFIGRMPALWPSIA
ncbi:MAG: hypothetical protein C4346_12630 [Chloroflexota bacterium]